jgi:hypothetical protein
MSFTLDRSQKGLRKLLIETATGNLKTDRARLISYKELWERISREDWGRAKVRELVPRIFDISVFEISHGRPPLNELVVRKDKGVSGDEWDDTKRCLEKESGLTLPYLSHREAQEACWRYWGRESDSDNTDRGAEEGYQQDRSVTFRKRNARLIKERKKQDNYTCQACGFRLQVNETFIIDCHHKYPLSHGHGARITEIDDLICLCPTCHRISHTRKHPLEADEIRKRRGCAGRSRSRP